MCPLQDRCKKQPLYETENIFVLFYASMFILHKTHQYFFFAQDSVTFRDMDQVM